ncbi:meiotic recombination DMC1 protein [Rutstroemia sp. NJR-2017a WRK4]|nr:meiotic recombination DMC1 protein [Rutstroemia sp. NJR-2017a WRK4]
MDTSGSGGFLPQSLPSPSPSTSSLSSTTSNLPNPRTHPLRPGSAKEDAARRYVESRLLHISRRYTKKFQAAEEGDTVTGYTSMKDAAKDLSEVVDVLWLSGTPSLQIPYLLNIALSINTYLPAFPPAPAPTFSLLRKLDHAFASLIKGEDIFTGAMLPGFQSGRRGGLSRTDMVRCQSLVESTRVLIVDVMSNEPEAGTEREEETGAETTDEDGMELDGEGAWDEDESGYEMDVARVYEHTIVQLGEVLGHEPGTSLEGPVNDL